MFAYTVSGVEVSACGITSVFRVSASGALWTVGFGVGTVGPVPLYTDAQ